MEDLQMPAETPYLKNDWRAHRNERGRMYYVTTAMSNSNEKRAYMTWNRNEALRGPGDPPPVAPTSPASQPSSPPMPSLPISSPSSRRISTSAFSKRMSFGGKRAFSSSSAGSSSVNTKDLVRAISLGLTLVKAGVKIGGEISGINTDFIDVDGIDPSSWFGGGGGGDSGGGSGGADTGVAVDSGSASIPSPVSPPVMMGDPFAGPIQAAAMDPTQ